MLTQSMQHYMYFTETSSHTHFGSQLSCPIPYKYRRVPKRKFQVSKKLSKPDIYLKSKIPAFKRDQLLPTQAHYVSMLVLLNVFSTYSFSYALVGLKTLDPVCVSDLSSEPGVSLVVDWFHRRVSFNLRRSLSHNHFLRQSLFLDCLSWNGMEVESYLFLPGVVIKCFCTSTSVLVELAENINGQFPMFPSWFDVFPWWQTALASQCGGPGFESGPGTIWVSSPLSSPFNSVPSIKALVARKNL